MQGLDPLPYGSRVQKAEVAKSLSSELSAHTESSTITNSDKGIISNSQMKIKGQKFKDAKSKHFIKKALLNSQKFTQSTQIIEF